MRRQQVVVHSEREIKGIRKAAQVTASVRDRLCKAVRPGMTTLELDQLAGEMIKDTGGSSAFYNYHGYPGQVCISLNDEVVHGIGRAGRVIGLGDLVSVDVGVRLDGFVGDTARTVCVPAPTAPDSMQLLKITEESLAAGIDVTKAGNYINDIGKAVENVVRSAGFSVVRDFVGHGCGCELHEPPEVPNFAQARRGPKLLPGMVLCIEPMVNLGTERVVVESDGWTVHTADRRLSAHFEHMVLITNHKPEILTWPRNA